jgi:large subunit ribosomal protein L21
VYAIVRCGGRQEKASVDDVLTVDLLTGEVGSTLTLPAVLVVDGDNVVTDPEELGGYHVAAEIMGDVSGPKINMIRYKNKTGYRRRLGHRQRYTQVKITGITRGGGRPESKSASAGKSAGAGKSASAGKSAGAGKSASAGKPATRAKPASKAKSASTRSTAAASKAETAAASKAETAEES